MDKNKHKLYMAQILGLIFKDKDLCNVMAFKGGTSLMFFHNLNRFSTDLDFNLLNSDKLDLVYDKVRAILTRFGTIDDEAKKIYGPVLVLNYGKGERMLKLEISIRQYPNHYEMRSLAGTDIRVMTMPDMFAHKLCALGERVTPRDIYDVWFFLQNRTEINANIVRLRTELLLTDYLKMCAQRVRETSPKLLMQGLGEVLLDNQSKDFVKKQLIEETATGLELFAMCPLIAKQPSTVRLQLIDTYPELVKKLNDFDIDISTVSEQALSILIDGRENLKLRNKQGAEIEVKL